MIKESIKKLQSLPEKRKIAIMVITMGLATIVTGYFWLRATQHNIAGMDEAVKSFNFPPLEFQEFEMPAIEGIDMEDQSTKESDSNIEKPGKEVEVLEPIE